MGVTVRDIARICGVNASTVSRALRDDPRVRKETRDKIKAIARDHGYTPNITAQNLAAGRTNTIWFFLGSLDNEIEQKPAIYLTNLLREHGYDLLMVLHNNSPEEFKRLLNKLSQKVSDGAIVIPPVVKDTDELNKVVEPLPVPIIFMDRWFPNLPNPVVTTDNHNSAITLAEKCRNAGADIFLVNFHGQNMVAQTRRQAACEYLTANKIEYYTEENFSAEILKQNPGKSLGVLGDSGDALAKLLHDKYDNELSERKIFGGFYDYWERGSSDLFSKVYICRQDFNEISIQAIRLMLNMLDNIPVTEKFITIPPEKIIEI